MVDAYRLDPGKISPWQLMLILIVMVISTADIFLPALVAAQSGRDSWIAVIIATLQGLVIAAVALALSRRFPKQNLFQICHTVMGKWLGWGIAFVIVLFFIFFGIKAVAQCGLVVKMAFLDNTPLLVLNGILVLVMAYAVYQGLEILARITEILAPIGIAILAFVGVFMLPQVDFRNFLPVLDEGLGPVLTGSIRLSSWLGEVFIILMLMPHLSQPKKVTKVVYSSILVLGSFLLVGVLSIGLFGAHTTAVTTFPALSMVRIIEVAEFLDHMDAFIMTIWVAGVFIKAGFIFYFCCIGYAQMAGSNRYRLNIIPIGIILTIGATFWMGDITFMKNFLATVWPSLAFTFVFFLPLVLLIVASARGLKEDENAGFNRGNSL